jgi:hypothetical protein
MTDADLWVVIPNWERFQHYTDRNPAWIKVYTELNSRDDFRALTWAERGLLLSIWCEYALANGLLRQSDVGPRCGASTRRQHWASLNDAGFIQLSASKPLALRARARALAREETETEKNNARTRVRKPATDEPRAAAAAYKPHVPDDVGDLADAEVGLELARRLAGQRPMPPSKTDDDDFSF